MKDTTLPLVINALARGVGYDLLAQCFAHPDTDCVAALRVAANDALAVEGWVPMLRLAAIAREVPIDHLEPVWVSLITFSGSPDCPAFETAYFGSDAQQQTQRMADIAGFYRAFGVDATSTGVRPDDLPVELEFMAYLCRKEAYAAEHLGAPRVAQAQRAQRLFLSEHLGRWGAVFGRNLAAAAPGGHFYALAAETLAIWIDRECAALGVTPDEIHGPIPPWTPPISHGPEFAGRAAIVPMDDIAVR
ncbi:MAG TPA: molecular chaperone TorD family protein [Dehalococcoidia bacterium]|nr:molecular chaperone TorD family protein [Dehalococcoidia bacterium]